MINNTVESSKIQIKFKQVFEEIGKVIVGQGNAIEQIMIAILCDGNALLEGYPGLGKTLMVSTLAKIMDLKFSRIQNTPDLMPSDITGTYIIEETTGKRHFKFQPGPIFANIVLADEINRATPKTQAALLEAMQEKQVTIGNNSFQLDRPFFVLATQNPIEQEGTYPLPEAQTDRFLFKINIDYPEIEDELKIVDRYTGAAHIEPRKILGKTSLLYLQNLVKQVPVANDIKKEAVEIVSKTRKLKSIIEYGASPRASLGLILAAKAKALINGRNHVSTQDLHSVAFPVLRHRLILNFEAERKGMTPDHVIEKLLK